ncbi:MAG: cysteine desulfurase [Flavobacterium sp.]|jgi:cysteine desulfurase|nr:cysteine desulfurase [Flavobacterium sp.]|tara:strand:- start:2639 stop:3772 length:1134 start_codon:yes stop_codon:yes gene_type:complete
MKKVYLDNAATTAIDSSVIEVMHRSMQENFGNPSSSHQYGRKAKNLIENARINIANLFHVTASEIIFTAGGTEADNLILQNAVTNLGIERIISSKIEHHAVSHTIDFLKDKYSIDTEYVSINSSGEISLEHLEKLLKKSKKKTLVSLMFINNEIGNILPINNVCDLCDKYQALFHSDTVQAIGHYSINLQNTPIDFMVASAHKFHGPKGVGFAFFKKGFGIQPLFHGGNQEKGARSSTENVHGILGMEKALLLATDTLEADKSNMNSLKLYFINSLKKLSSRIRFNGMSSKLEESSCTILNVLLPISNEMLIFNLDLHGIAASGGSACQSGSNKGSHVLHEILDQKDKELSSIRFSFSRFTNKDEIDYTISKIKELL